MKFLNYHFLYFLPVALLPILIYLFDRIKRKPVIFSSTEIIQEIIKEKRKKLRINLFLRQVIKTIILAILIFSFAWPVFETDMRNFVAIIDPTYSMKDFNLFEIIEILKKKMPSKIYVGANEYNGEIIYDRELDLVKIINRVVEKEKNFSILLITDGQMVNFNKIEFLNKNVTNLEIILLKHSNKNYYFKDVEIYPIVFSDLSELNIRMDFYSDKEVKIVFYLNDKPFAEKNAKQTLNFSFMPDSSILKNGENILRLEIISDDFDYDNKTECGFYFIPDMKFYVDRSNFLFYNYIKKVIKSLFGSNYETKDLKDADIVFLTGVRLNNSVPTYIIPENGIKSPFVRDEKELYGEISSKLYPSLNVFKNIRLKNTIKYTSGVYDFFPCVYVDKTPVVYKTKDTYLFTFNISENLSELSENPFIPIFLYETFSSYFKNKIKVKSEFPSEESSFEFYSKNDLSEKIKKASKNLNLKILDLEKLKENKVELRVILVLLCILLLTIEAFA